MNEEQLERCYIRRVLILAVIVLVVSMFVLGIGTAKAEPFARADADNGSVTLHKAPCELKTITNLPYKAVWVEGNKTFEGCWANHPFGVVIAYFEDATVVLIPPQVFQPVRQM